MSDFQIPYTSPNQPQFDFKNRDPHCPEETMCQNQPVMGRPRILPSLTQWHHPSLTSASRFIPDGQDRRATNDSEVLDVIMKRGLDNSTGVCYRNAVLQLLLNLPALVNFAANHRLVCPKAQSFCLICLFRQVAEVYHEPGTSPNIDHRLHSAVQTFWDACLRVFWGPRAGRKRKVGPFDMSSGGSHGELLFYLLVTMKEQLQDCPS